MVGMVESFAPLEVIQVSELSSGGTDIWLRRNQTTKHDPFIEGEQIIYTAEEAYLRVSERVTVDEATERFSELWAQAENYDPSTIKPITQTEQWRTDVENALIELADLIAGGE